MRGQVLSPVQLSEHPHNSVLPEPNSSLVGGMGSLWDLSRHFGAIQKVTTTSKKIPVKAMGRKMGFCVSACVQ